MFKTSNAHANYTYLFMFFYMKFTPQGHSPIQGEEFQGIEPRHNITRF